MALNGTIDKFYLADILQLLCNGKKTGALHVWHLEKEIKIYINEGTIVYAIGSEKNLRLGYILRKKELISKEALQKCMRISKEKKQALGKVLVENNLISEKDLEQCVHEKVEETLYNLFLWNKGHFEFKETKLNLAGQVLTRMDTIGVILEASRRADETRAARGETDTKRRATTITLL